MLLESRSFGVNLIECNDQFQSPIHSSLNFICHKPSLKYANFNCSYYMTLTYIITFHSTYSTFLVFINKIHYQALFTNTPQTAKHCHFRSYSLSIRDLIMLTSSSFAMT